MLVNSRVTNVKDIRTSSYTTPNKIRRIRLQNNTRSLDEINHRLAKLDLDTTTMNKNLRITKYDSTQNDRSKLEIDNITVDIDEEDDDDKQENQSPIDNHIDLFKNCWDFVPEPICCFPIVNKRNNQANEQQLQYDKSWKDHFTANNDLSRLS